MNEDHPRISVIMATPRHWQTLRRPLRFLQQLTNREEVELILIGPGDESFEGMDSNLVSGFANYQQLSVGLVDEVERVFAPGIEVAQAPVVALLENHVYVEPQWAEAIIKAYEGPWTVVGCVISNANLATATSWVEHLMSYVFHDELAPTGEVPRVSRNNSTYLRQALTQFKDELPDKLSRDGGLMDVLQQQGARFYRAPGANMAHLNPSKTTSMLKLRLHSARASSSTRARMGNWSLCRRLLYVLASPLFPLLRIRALWSRLWSPPVRPELPRIAPLLLVALVVDAFGQGLGFGLGEGNSAQAAGIYDLDREPYLTSADKAEFMS